MGLDTAKEELDQNLFPEEELISYQPKIFGKNFYRQLLKKLESLGVTIQIEMATRSCRNLSFPFEAKNVWFGKEQKGTEKSRICR